MKRGVELSVNFIIIAVLALVILIVAIYFIVIAGGNVRDAKNTCELRGGHCVQEASCPGSSITVPGIDCEGGVCCVGS